MPASPPFFTDCDVISSYTREQALADGVLLTAMEGELEEVTRQHFTVPVAMTASVFGIIKRAVENPRCTNDYRGVWHDVCWMLTQAIARLPRRNSQPELLFSVIITGAARGQQWTFKAVIAPDDQGEPCLTLMLPDED
jgi:hypothetical protein